MSLAGLQEGIADDDLERNVGKHKQLMVVDLSEVIRESPKSLHLANRVEFFPIGHKESVMLACSMRSVFKTGLHQGKCRNSASLNSTVRSSIYLLPVQETLQSGDTVFTSVLAKPHLPFMWLVDSCVAFRR